MVSNGNSFAQACRQVYLSNSKTFSLGCRAVLELTNRVLEVLDQFVFALNQALGLL